MWERTGTLFGISEIEMSVLGRHTARRVVILWINGVCGWNSVSSCSASLDFSGGSLELSCFATGTNRCLSLQTCPSISDSRRALLFRTRSRTNALGPPATRPSNHSEDVRLPDALREHFIAQSVTSIREHDDIQAQWQRALALPPVGHQRDKGVLEFGRVSSSPLARQVRVDLKVFALRAQPSRPRSGEAGPGAGLDTESQAEPLEPLRARKRAPSRLGTDYARSAFDDTSGWLQGDEEETACRRCRSCAHV